MKIPEYSLEELKQISLGAGILLGRIGGTAAGTAGGLAAAGVTTAAIMTFRTASTGAAITLQSGVAAPNETLLELGDEAITTDSGITIGTTIFGSTILGMGILVDGFIFNAVGKTLLSKADVAWDQMKKAEGEIKNACTYMNELLTSAQRFNKAITIVEKIYIRYISKLINIVEKENKSDWQIFTKEEKIILENTIYLVHLLVGMGKVELVLVSEDEYEINKVNKKEIDKSLADAETILEELGVMVVM